MQWKICEGKIQFHTQTLNYIQMDQMYAQQKKKKKKKKLVQR